MKCQIIFSEILEKYLKMSSAEFFTHHALFIGKYLSWNTASDITLKMKPDQKHNHPIFC